MNFRFIVIILAACFLGACAKKVKPKQLHKIELGMTKEEVQKTLGDPAVIRGSYIRDDNRVIELWEYNVDMGWSEAKTTLATLFTIYTLGIGFPIWFDSGDIIATYWLYFYSNNLVKWCKAGDFETTQHQINEIRIR